MHEYTIDIVDYDLTWPTLFEREAERLHTVIGEHVISIEHVGSTSVTGLAAKPIIDICPVVEDMDTAKRVSELLDDSDWPFLRDRDDDIGDWIEHERISESNQEYNVHIRPREEAIESYLLFRNYLRHNPDMRDEYGRIKRQAAKEYPHDITQYTEEKSDVIERAKERARQAGYDERIEF